MRRSTRLFDAVCCDWWGPAVASTNTLLWVVLYSGEFRVGGCWSRLSLKRFARNMPPHVCDDHMFLAMEELSSPPRYYLLESLFSDIVFHQESTQVEVLKYLRPSRALQRSLHSRAFVKLLALLSPAAIDEKCATYRRDQEKKPKRGKERRATYTYGRHHLYQQQQHDGGVGGR